MKIIGLKADGVRKLTAVEIKFAEQGITYIKGDNEQGKTSIIDTIFWLFKGKSVVNDQIIQHGKTRAIATIELENYDIRRIQTEKSTSLQITNKDGFTMSKKPQAFLDKLVNDLTFDPFVFLNKTGQQKFKFLMDFFDVDTSDFDTAISELDSQRKYVKQKLKEMGVPIEVENADTVDLHELYHERQKIEEYNQVQNDLNKARMNTQADIDSSEAKKQELLEEISRIKEEIKSVESDISTSKDVLGSLDTPEEIKPFDEIDAKIAGANETNVKAKDYQDYLEAVEQREETEAKEKELTASIKEVRNEKIQFFTTIDTGLEGLELKEDGVYYNGIFSENWSDSESIRISASLCLSMNPELKAVFVDRGESFGARRLKELEQWAIDNDIQVILTKVDDEIPEEVEENVYYIEEGKIIRGGNEDE